MILRLQQRVREQRQDLATASSASDLVSAGRPWQRRLPAPSNRRITRRDASKAVSRLAELAEAGLSPVEAMAVATRAGGRPGRVLERCARDLQRGHSLSSALARRMPALRASEIAILRAGERAGDERATLRLLDRKLTQEREDTRQLRAAAAYPLFLVIAALLALVFLSTAVLPAFADLYANDTTKLPQVTRVFMTIGTWLSASGPQALLSMLVLCAAAAAALRRSARLRLERDRLLLTLAPLSLFVQASQKTSAYSLLAVLTGAGGELGAALELATESCSNRAFAQRLAVALRCLRRGLPLSTCWQRGGLDPHGEETPILQIAEAGGNYAAAFGRLEAASRVRRDAMVRRTAGVIEPLAVAFMGIVVAGGVLSLYAPVLDSASRLGGGLP